MTTKMNGIDVSLYQGNIDWKKVKDAGIEFAFIKSSQGGKTKTAVFAPFADPKFIQNITGANEAGIKCGIYHYLICDDADEVRAEAKYVIDLIEPYRDMITFPVVVDFEEQIYLSKDRKEKNTELLHAFTEEILEAGYTPMVYASRSYFNDFIDLSALGNIDIWVAVYTTPRQDENPNTAFPVMAWQWDDSGTVDGIKGNVDMNIGYHDYSAERYFKGDVDGDGKITANDVFLAKRIYFGLYKPNEKELYAADINGDGKVGATDYFDIKKLLFGVKPT